MPKKIPTITIHVKGGVVQDVDWKFKTPNIKVIVKDYDCEDDINDTEEYGNVKLDKHGVYQESVYESMA